MIRYSSWMLKHSHNIRLVVRCNIMFVYWWMNSRESLFYTAQKYFVVHLFSSILYKHLIIMLRLFELVVDNNVIFDACQRFPTAIKVNSPQCRLFPRFQITFPSPTQRSVCSSPSLQPSFCLFSQHSSLRVMTPWCTDAHGHITHDYVFPHITRESLFPRQLLPSSICSPLALGSYYVFLILHMIGADDALCIFCKDHPSEPALGSVTPVPALV